MSVDTTQTNKENTVGTVDDGTGTGKKAKVDESNRLHTAAETISHEQNHTIEGYGFIIYFEYISYCD